MFPAPHPAQAVLFPLFLPDFALRAKIWKNKSLTSLLPQANPTDD
jgi:hypothetical protein